MQKRAIESTGQMISPIGLGCVTFGREIDQDASFRLLDYAVEKGISLLDTAEAYGGGQSRALREKSFGIKDNREVSAEASSSEKIIGRWLKLRNIRDKITICTKVRPRRPDGAITNISKSLKGSLERLSIDCVDIYEIHSPDDEIPIDQTLAELTELVEKGLIQTIGCSNYSTEQLRQALKVSDEKGYKRFDVVQPCYNLIVPDADKEMFPLCMEEKIAVTPFSPLCQGFLVGKYTKDTASIPKGSRFDILPTHGPRYFTDRNFHILDNLRRKAQDMGIPVVRLAMAWVMTHPAVTSTLFGARKKEHIDNAIEALQLKLDPDLRREMRSWGNA